MLDLVAPVLEFWRDNNCDKEIVLGGSSEVDRSRPGGALKPGGMLSPGGVEPNNPVDGVEPNKPLSCVL